MERMEKEDNDVSSWKKHPLNPKTMDKDAANWIFVCDLLNFSFWSDNPGQSYTVSHGGIEYKSYWAWCAALNRSKENSRSLYDYHIVSELSFEEFRELMRPDKGPELALLQERYQILRSAALKILDKYDGCFTNLIKAANNDAIKLISILIVEFSSLFDVAWYHDRQVFFLKRAQILVADLWACFEGESWGKFSNIDCITMFADYRVPQVLRYLDILTYSPKLQSMLEAQTLLQPGSDMECQIRGCSIYAVELLRIEILKNHPDANVNAIILDFYLWDSVAKNHEISKIPFHRCRTVYY